MISIRIVGDRFLVAVVVALVGGGFVLVSVGLTLIVGVLATATEVVVIAVHLVAWGGTRRNLFILVIVIALVIVVLAMIRVLAATSLVIVPIMPVVAILILLRLASAPVAALAVYALAIRAHEVALLLHVLIWRESAVAHISTSVLPVIFVLLSLAFLHPVIVVGHLITISHVVAVGTHHLIGALRAAAHVLLVVAIVRVVLILMLPVALIVLVP